MALEKQIVVDLIENDNQLNQDFQPENAQIIKKLYQEVGTAETPIQLGYNAPTTVVKKVQEQIPVQEVVEAPLSLQAVEAELIKRALIKHKGKRKKAAQELGIAERTLYRKIDDYHITEPVYTKQKSFTPKAPIERKRKSNK